MDEEPLHERILRYRSVHKGFSRFGVADVQVVDGTVVHREIEDHGAAAAVLPYDPDRRSALLVRQCRIPLLHLGEPSYTIEAPAGLIDDGETPEACIRREALEEVGLRLGHLEPLGAPYSMPGISTERIHLYLAAFGPADRVQAGGGLASEHESITVVELPLTTLADMADQAGFADLKTLTLVLALRLRHPALFAA